MKRCSYEVVILCCQLEAALEHRDKVTLATCCLAFFGTLTHRIAVQTPFSDLKSCRMEYLLFFYHWATFFRCSFFFSTASKIFRLVGTFYPENRKKWDCGGKTYVRLSMSPPVVAELPKASSKSRVRTVHAKGAECSPPCCEQHPHTLAM
jgi:hypothetical protein